MADAEPPRSLKHYFFAGLFILIPAALTLLVVGWVVRAVDGLLGAVLGGLLGIHIPGLGLLLTLGLIFLVGMLVSTNLLAQQIFTFFEHLLLRVPGVRAIYKTVKALTDAFSPENQKALQSVVLVEFPHPGSFSIGFATSRLTVTGPGGLAEVQVAVYVPTNHFYFGNVVLVPESKVRITDLSVQQGIQIVLSSGASFPPSIAAKEAARP